MGLRIFEKLAPRLAPRLLGTLGEFVHRKYLLPHNGLYINSVPSRLCLNNAPKKEYSLLHGRL